MVQQTLVAYYNAWVEDFRISISGTFKLESFLATRQEESLLLFPAGLGSFCPATSASFLSPGAYLMSSSHNKGSQTQTLGRDAFPVNTPCLFRMRKVCPEIRDHRSSNPNNGQSASLPSPSLSHPTVQTSFFNLKIHLSWSQIASKLHDVTGPDIFVCVLHRVISRVISRKKKGRRKKKELTTSVALEINCIREESLLGSNQREGEKSQPSKR